MLVIRSLLIVCGLVLTSILSAGEKPAPTKVTLTNAMHAGKKTWSPSEIKAKTGETVELTLDNTLSEEHGFQIPGLVDPLVIPAKSKKTISFQAPAPGTINFSCHIHPLHVGGKLVTTN